MTGVKRLALADSVLRERTAEAERTLNAASPGAAKAAAEYCLAIRACPAELPYHGFSQEVLDGRDALKREGGTALVAAVHRYVILRLIPESRGVLLERAHLAPVREWFEDAVARMVSDMAATPEADLDLHADAFVKDLSIAALRLWPLGAVAVDPRLALPRRWMVEGGVKTLLLGLGVLARLGGSFPLYQIHAYTRHLSEFTEPGWVACYRRIARIMRDEPGIRGVYGGTWFYDPALQDVSPHLAYLRRLPIENGAVFARIRSTHDTYANALYKSATRRGLYAAGRYEPRQYIMIWPRRDLLRWAGAGQGNSE